MNSADFAPEFRPDFSELVKRSHALAKAIGIEPMRVLVVDDNEGMRALIRAALARENQEFIVDECITGEDAEKRLRSERFDLAIIDQVLPGKHGIEVVRDLEREGAKFSWILVSGYVDERGNLEREARALGAHTVLKKGVGIEWFSLKQLAATIRCAIQAWRVNRFIHSEIK
jgi:DNA-binding NarL/FixJ family response regulator